MVQKREVQRRDPAWSLTLACEEADDNGDGELSLDFRAALRGNDHIKVWFDKLELARWDAEELFAVLDYDRSGAISQQEFGEGCLRAKENAKHLRSAHYTLQKAWAPSRSRTYTSKRR